MDQEAFVCFTSDGYVIANVPLSTLVGDGTFAVGVTVLAVAPAAGDSDSYGVQVYAGITEDNYCGTANGNISGGAFNNPLVAVPGSPAVNPAAASLTNPAQGGTITPTITMTLEG
jgi:hypothetical protein